MRIIKSKNESYFSLIKSKNGFWVTPNSEDIYGIKLNPHFKDSLCMRLFGYESDSSLTVKIWRHFKESITGFFLFFVVNQLLTIPKILTSKI